MLNIILAILVLAFLIFFHELGHFTVGKLLGFRVLGFSMGFGPALVKFKKGDTEYALRAIPFGGSCQFDGEDEDAETDPKRFNAQPVWKRFLVILAGPFMNVLLAFLIAFILMLAVPMPVYAVDAGSGDNIPYIVDVVEGSAAEKAGILPGDIVIAVDGKNTMDANDGIESIDALVKFIGEASNDLYITIDRDGVVADLFAQDVYNAELGWNQLGISIAAVIENTKHLTVDKAFTGSFEYLGQIITATAKGIDSMFKNGIHQGDVSGVVGTVAIMADVANDGLINLVYIAVILSLSLGLFNLIPFPALDG
ncbi:MAG: site-2 protease family protein, partial [Clostridium sp.]|nr:site-2 protease family protein [Clostridium sp.]